MICSLTDLAFYYFYIQQLNLRIRNDKNLSSQLQNIKKKKLNSLIIPDFVGRYSVVFFWLSCFLLTQGLMTHDWPQTGYVAEYNLGRCWYKCSSSSPAL